jgi:hypothetical protein
MIRILIIAVAVVLVIGGVGAALSGAEDQDPGSAIVLDKAPIDAAGSAHDGKGAGASAGGHALKDGDRVGPSKDRSDEGDPFTAAQPQPVKADEPDGPDDSDEPDESDESDDEESDD